MSVLSLPDVLVFLYILIRGSVSEFKDLVLGLRNYLAVKNDRNDKKDTIDHLIEEGHYGTRHYYIDNEHEEEKYLKSLQDMENLYVSTIHHVHGSVLKMPELLVWIHSIM